MLRIDAEGQSLSLRLMERLIRFIDHPDAFPRGTESPARFGEVVGSGDRAEEYETLLNDARKNGLPIKLSLPDFIRRVNVAPENELGLCGAGSKEILVLLHNIGPVMAPDGHYIPEGVSHYEAYMTGLCSCPAKFIHSIGAQIVMLPGFMEIPRVL